MPAMSALPTDLPEKVGLGALVGVVGMVLDGEVVFWLPLLSFCFAARSRLDYARGIDLDPMLSTGSPGF
jgi:hypothetical protein